VSPFVMTEAQRVGRTSEAEVDNGGESSDWGAGVLGGWCLMRDLLCKVGPVEPWPFEWVGSAKV
jgi:hypothetical protein